MMKSIRVLLASAILAFAALPAMAADFTFIVPVDVSNLPPEIVSFHTACAVATATMRTNTGEILQEALTTVAVRDRGYRGDVTVEVNVLPTRRADATHYRCEIRDFATATRLNYSIGVGPQQLPRGTGPFRNETDFRFIPIPR